MTVWKITITSGQSNLAKAASNLFPLAIGDWDLIWHSDVDPVSRFCTALARDRHAGWRTTPTGLLIAVCRVMHGVYLMQHIEKVGPSLQSVLYCYSIRTFISKSIVEASLDEQTNVPGKDPVQGRWKQKACIHITVQVSLHGSPEHQTKVMIAAWCYSHRHIVSIPEKSAGLFCITKQKYFEKNGRNITNKCATEKW